VEGDIGMVAPLLSYVTFNRLGQTIRSLSSVLETPENFELAIVDNNSTDGTWKYIQSLKDRRIKFKTRLPVNLGQVYASNLNLSKRRDDQYFIAVDQDVVIESKNWLTYILRVFKNTPNIGLLSIHAGFPPPNMPPTTPVIKNDLVYLELTKNRSDYSQDYMPGSILALSPDLISKIGFWSEENNFGSRELFLRANHFTAFKTGILMNVNISIPQQIICGKCPGQSFCRLSKNGETKTGETCYTIYEKLNHNKLFREQYRWKFDETVKDLQSGARSPYCTSLFSCNSTAEESYNLDWATENFQFYASKAN
jgi:Predicted glycosyltransferases